MTIIVSEVNARVRFLCGGLTEAQLSDVILDQIINDCITKIGSEDEFFCEVTYCSLIDALRYLVRSDQGSNSGASGDVKRRKEVNGKRQIEVEYETGNSSGGSSGWQSILDEFLADPSLVCDSLVTSSTQGLVLIGGVSETEYARVENRVDGRNAYQLNVSNKYNRSTSYSTRRRPYR